MSAVQGAVPEAAGQPASWELYHIFTCSYKAYKLGLLSLELIRAQLTNY